MSGEKDAYGSLLTFPKESVTAPTFITVSATNVLCNKDGEILQLYVDNASGYREWRKLPSFEEAVKTYACDKIV